MGGGKNPLDGLSLLAAVVHDLITCFKFGDGRFRGLASAEGQILPFPIDFDGRPYNALTLPCERVLNGTDIDLGTMFRKSIYEKLTLTNVTATSFANPIRPPDTNHELNAIHLTVKC